MDLKIIKDKEGFPTIFVMQSLKGLGKTGKKAMVHVHGGNGFLGVGIQNTNLFNHIAQNTDTVIFSPSYRLSPRFKAPIQQQDIAATIDYVVKYGNLHGADKNKIILSGDSAGGNIAAGTALYLKDRQQTDKLIKCMILFQPMLNDFIYTRPRNGATEGEKNWGPIIRKSFEMLSTDFMQQ